MLWNIEQITGYRHLCISEHWTDHRTEYRTDHRTDHRTAGLLHTGDKLNCQLHWSGQSGFIIVSLYIPLRAYQLTVIIILDFK